MQHSKREEGFNRRKDIYVRVYEYTISLKSPLLGLQYQTQSSISTPGILWIPSCDRVPCAVKTIAIKLVVIKSRIRKTIAEAIVGDQDLENGGPTSL